MALKKYKPYTPGLRQKTTLVFDELTTKQAGEVSHAETSEECRARFLRPHQCSKKGRAGHKRAYRIIDFKREEAWNPRYCKDDRI